MCVCGILMDNTYSIISQFLRTDSCENQLWLIACYSHINTLWLNYAVYFECICILHPIYIVEYLFYTRIYSYYAEWRSDILLREITMKLRVIMRQWTVGTDYLLLLRHLFWWIKILNILKDVNNTSGRYIDLHEIIWRVETRIMKKLFKYFHRNFG